MQNPIYKRNNVLSIQIQNTTEITHTIELFGSCSNIGKKFPEGIEVINLGLGTYSELLYYFLSNSMSVNKIFIETNKKQNFQNTIIYECKDFINGVMRTSPFYDFKIYTDIDSFYCFLSQDNNAEGLFPLGQFEIKGNHSLAITIEPKSILTFAFYSHEFEGKAKSYMEGI